LYALEGNPVNIHIFSLINGNNPNEMFSVIHLIDYSDAFLISVQFEIPAQINSGLIAKILTVTKVFLKFEAPCRKRARNLRL